MRNGQFPRLSRGFTLVELMVGVLIGLIGTVVIFQVFAVSEGQKRTTTGGSDAQQNGVFGALPDRARHPHGRLRPELHAAPRLPDQRLVRAGQPADLLQAACRSRSSTARPARRTASGSPSATPTSSWRRRSSRSRCRARRPSTRSTTASDSSRATWSSPPRPASPAPSRRPRISPGTPGNSDNVDPQQRQLQERPGRQRAGAITTAPAGCRRPTTSPTTSGTRPPTPAAGSTTSAPRPRWSPTPSRTTSSSPSTSSPRAGPNATFALADGVVQLQAQYGYDGDQDGNIASTAALRHGREPRQQHRPVGATTCRSRRRAPTGRASSRCAWW